MMNRCLLSILFLLILTPLTLSQTADEAALPEEFTSIPKVSDVIVIDGVLDEWDSASAIFVSDKSTQPYDDCSGIFNMMWDEKNLYFSAKVYDDELIQGQPANTIYAEDCVQFDLDIDRDGDKKATGFSDDDFQIGFSPGNFDDEKPTICGWNPGGGKAMGVPEDGEIVSTRFDGGWIMEARINISELNSDLIDIDEFYEGMIIGFGRCINDYDADGEGGVSSEGAWQDTSKMYDVELGKEMTVDKNDALPVAWGKLKK